MFGLGKKKVDLQVPFPAPTQPLSTVSDEVFASEMMGPGFAVSPSENTTGVINVVAPADGTLVTVFKTGHAFALKTPQGLEVLVHIGLDTVNLKGEGFQAVKQAGDTVSAGDVIVQADLDVIRKAGYDPVTMVVCTNKKAIGKVDVHENGAKVTMA